MPEWVTNPWLITIVGGILILIIWEIIKKYFIKKKNMENNFNVSSSNQQGGITAGQININSGKQRRHLTEETKKDLTSHLANNKTKNMVIEVLLGDDEAYQYAAEIRDYLSSLGFNIEGGISRVIPHPSDPIIGDELRFDEKTGDFVRMRIGSR